MEGAETHHARDENSLQVCSWLYSVAECHKGVRVSCPIPFKSQVRLALWRVAIMMADFPSAKTERFTEEREETDLLVREVKAC